VLAFPAETRAALGLHVLESGKHLLTEKPVAMNAGEVKQLIAAEDPRASPFLRARLGKEKNEAVRKLILTAIARAKVQPEELPFGDRLRMLAHARKWKEIKAYLSTQPTERLIEALGIPEPLVKDTAQYLLIMRTGKAALGSDQAAWKKWWEAEGKKQAPQAPRPKERNRAEPIREKTTDYMDDEPDE